MTQPTNGTHRSSAAAAGATVSPAAAITVETKPTLPPGAICPAAAAAVCLLQQCAEFVHGVDDERYQKMSAAMMGGTIGKHVRHSLDHFAAVVAAALGGEADGAGVSGG